MYGFYIHSDTMQSLKRRKSYQASAWINLENIYAKCSQVQKNKYCTFCSYEIHKIVKITEAENRKVAIKG